MSEELYKERLEQAPPVDSYDFIQFLKENNKVVEETANWLVIENCKYHTEEKPWHTAFLKNLNHPFSRVFSSLHDFLATRDYWNWEWRKKAKSSQTLPDRFHVHLIKKQ